MLSIIVPVAPNETNWHNLLKLIDNCFLNSNITYEVILSSTKIKPNYAFNANHIWHCVKKNNNLNQRAYCMNEAVKIAKGDKLWFLHIDTIISKANIQNLINTYKELENKIYFFKLSFYDGSMLMKINAVFANLRSIVFNSPFGDQAFFMSKKIFLMLDGFDEKLQYGEDHMLIRVAYKNNIEIIQFNSTIKTSARKYISNGWFKTTYLHLSLWFKQYLEYR